MSKDSKQLAQSLGKYTLYSPPKPLAWLVWDRAITEAEDAFADTGEKSASFQSGAHFQPGQTGRGMSQIPFTAAETRHAPSSGRISWRLRVLLQLGCDGVLWRAAQACWSSNVGVRSSMSAG